MLTYLTRDLILHLIFFQSVILLGILSNLYIMYRSRQHAPQASYPPMSILIPARNEAENIARCINSLLEQDYPVFEILVLDDHSSDETPAILNKIASTSPHLRVLSGQPLPDGWLGKNWACTQLAEQAQGELLLFTDADTAYQPQALRALANVLISEKADLLTGFPCQEMGSWSERLIVPFFSWAFYSFIPLFLAHRMKLPMLSSAVGQMLLFRRSAYQAIGGHITVREQIAEDLSLARQVKITGLRWRMTHIADLVCSHMYHGGQQAFQGFSKNYFAAFDFRLLPYLFVFCWLAVMFWHPLVVLALFLSGMVPLAQPAALAACIGLSLALWVIPYWRLGFGVHLALLYPVTLLAIERLAINSLWCSLTGQLSWKGRRLASMRWRLF